MTRFSKKNTGNKTINLAGGIAIKQSPEMELVLSVVSTFLEDKFYESGDERISHLCNLVRMVEPEFVAKLAITARKDFHLRSVVHLLVGELSRIHRGDNLVSRTIAKIAERPDDLVEIVAYVGKPIPKQVKKGIRNALLKFSPYQLAKYKNEDKDTKLVDLFNLCHPNPKFATWEQVSAWKDLIEGKLKNQETWEARLSSGEDKKKVWRDMVMEKKIGYMALLRNLRNISEQADADTIESSCSFISDENEVKKSKQLPFRFYNAFENVDNNDMVRAISKAMDISLNNIPSFDGNTLIAVDVSGSMSGEPVKKASIFAGALMKSNNAELVLFDTSIRSVKMLPDLPVLATAQKIQEMATGGGTETSLVFRYAAQSKVKYDRIIIISDNESWVENYGVKEYYRAYKEINDCFVYCIDIEGYGTTDLSGGKVFHVGGWSDKIFDLMKALEGGNTIVDSVKNVEL